MRRSQIDDQPLTDARLIVIPEPTLNSRSRASGIGERIFCYCPIDLAATKLPLTLVLQDPVLPENSLQLIMW